MAYKSGLVLSFVRCGTSTSSVRPRFDVEGCAAFWSVDDHADGSGHGRRGWCEVESLGDAGDDQGEFHLGEGEPDAHVWSSPERYPCLVGGRLLCWGQLEVPVGVEAQWVGPGVRVAPGEVRGPDDEGAFADAVVPEVHVVGGDAGTDEAGWVETQRFVDDALGVFEAGQRGVVRLDVGSSGGPRTMVCFAAEFLPDAGFGGGAPQQPGEGGGGGVVSGADEGVDLVADFGVGQGGVVGDDFEDVERVADVGWCGGRRPLRR